MSQPRPVIPGAVSVVTRRCTQRQFLLRPDDETNNAFVYCLAVAAQRCEVDVILPQMMSNHHHTSVHDRYGHQTEFREYFHGLFARCQNAHRGRWENLWNTQQPSVVEVVGREALLERLVYVATNPVKDGLVERVHHWPGPKFLQALLTGKPMRAHRPKHFFREDGDLPEVIELTLGLPPFIEDVAEFLAELRARIAAVEEQHIRARQASGRRVIGRARIRRQSWRDSPTTDAPRRALNPRVSSRDTWSRIATLQRNRAFEEAYRDARERWLAGLPAVFPYGTYWLRRFANVPVARPSSSQIEPS